MPRSILISLTTEQADRKLCPPVFLRSFVHPRRPYRTHHFGSAISFIAGADLFQQLLKHLQPIMRDARHKLSKRYGAASYKDFINKGYLKDAIVNYIALLGWSPKSNTEKMTLAELEANFSLAGLNKSPAIFDEPKLRWLSGEYIKEASDEEFRARALPFLQKSKAYGKYDEAKLLSIVKSRVDILEEIPAKLDFLEEYGAIDPALYGNKKMKSDAAVAAEVLPAAEAALAELDVFDNDSVYAALVALAQRLGRKNGQILWCVRIALTARENTPGGASEMAELLGKERSLARLAAARGALQA